MKFGVGRYDAVAIIGLTAATWLFFNAMFPSDSLGLDDMVLVCTGWTVFWFAAKLAYRRIRPARGRARPAARRARPASR
jgi:hypothetical protein